MEMTGIWGGFYRISLWVMRLAYINILWILFTVIGFIICGYMPATVALFTVIRKWIHKETDIPIFKTFLGSFKKEFKIANLFGIILLITGAILYVDLQYVGTVNDSPLYPILLGGLFLAGVIYFILVLYIIPVYVHYNLSFWQYIKYAILIGLTNLHYSITMVLILYGLYLLMMHIPGLFPFFSISTAAFIVMLSANLSFGDLQRKQNKINNKDKLGTESD